ncbi:hypothetical protein [Photobacterium piscicola]|uniref:hypothetical protein n=1 Tax=Photobacterium piscicola TaxID=1378299 RepID=UPI002E19195E|nr:hypothetical protein [Photobacterium piscicola]
MPYLACCINDSNPILKCSENRMEFSVINKQRNSIRLITVDGCLIQKNKNKCDYLYEFYTPVNNADDIITKAIYVELKGTDLDHAVHQIKETISHCNQRHINAKKEAFIVCSRVPKAGTAVQILKKKLMASSNSLLQIQTRQHKYIV